MSSQGSQGPIGATQKERMIYRYKDESGVDRYADPLKIQYLIATGMENLDIDEDTLFKNLGNDDLRVSYPSIQRLAPILAHAFEVQRLDARTGQGMVDEELLELYNDFLEYVEKVKKNIDDSVSTSITGEPGEETHGTAGSSGVSPTGTTSTATTKEATVPTDITNPVSPVNPAAPSPAPHPVARPASTPSPAVEAVPTKALQAESTRRGPQAVPNRPSWVPSAPPE